jgi:GIY-YIG catalytic domain/Cytochrome C oxidase subunit II, transmembrane domain/NUMOD1 domain
MNNQQETKNLGFSRLSRYPQRLHVKFAEGAAKKSIVQLDNVELTLIELVWTITPALILILIAFPSFKLLYLMDEVSDPAISVLAEGLSKSYDDLYLYLYLPARVYGNSDVQKFDILKENKDKSGIYLWRNLVNSKIYIGSAINLRRRLYIYYSLKIFTYNTSMHIYRALLKYGYSNFSLEILEYCDPKDVIKSFARAGRAISRPSKRRRARLREQYYIDLLKPQYNLLKTAGSSTGYKHTEESKLQNSLSQSKRVKIEVIDLKLNTKTSYNSIREAAKSIGKFHRGISSYFFN